MLGKIKKGGRLGGGGVESRKRARSHPEKTQEGEKSGKRNVFGGKCNPEKTLWKGKHIAGHRNPPANVKKKNKKWGVVLCQKKPSKKKRTAP